MPKWYVIWDFRKHIVLLGCRILELIFARINIALSARLQRCAHGSMSPEEVTIPSCRTNPLKVSERNEEVR